MNYLKQIWHRNLEQTVSAILTDFSGFTRLSLGYSFYSQVFYVAQDLAQTSFEGAGI